MERTELTRAQQKYLRLAQKIANQRIQAEILPKLNQAGFKLSPRDWRPIRLQSQNVTDLSQMLVPGEAPEIRFILGNWPLYQQVEKIVVDALDDAFFRNTQIEANPFIAAILRDLMTDDSVLHRLSVTND